VALSIPLVLGYTHPAVAGPVLASHPLDLQAFPPQEGDKFSGVAHVGPAGVNIEAKLVGVDDEKMEKGANPCGELYVRGPSVGDVAGEAAEWLRTGNTAQVYTSGAFKVLY
jgi:long-chain acyl-CoA synthetase